MSKAIDQISLPNRLLSDGAVPVNPAAPKEAVLHHALAKQKKNNHQDNHKHELSHSERGWFWSCRSLCIQRSCHLIAFAPMYAGYFSTHRTPMTLIGIRSSASLLKIPEPITLLFSQRHFAGQYFPQSPVNAFNAFGDRTNKLMIFGYVD